MYISILVAIQNAVLAVGRSFKNAGLENFHRIGTIHKLMTYNENLLNITCLFKLYHSKTRYTEYIWKCLQFMSDHLHIFSILLISIMRMASFLNGGQTIFRRRSNVAAFESTNFAAPAIRSV
jgi:hypothetical protein